MTARSGRQTLAIGLGYLGTAISEGVMAHSNWLYLIVETIAEARNGGKAEPRQWRSPLSKGSLFRRLVGLRTPIDSFEQRGARAALHWLFRKNA